MWYVDTLGSTNWTDESRIVISPPRAVRSTVQRRERIYGTRALPGYGMVPVIGLSYSIKVMTLRERVDAQMLSAGWILWSMSLCRNIVFLVASRLASHTRHSNNSSSSSSSIIIIVIPLLDVTLRLSLSPSPPLPLSPSPPLSLSPSLQISLLRRHLRVAWKNNRQRSARRGDRMALASGARSLPCHTAKYQWPNPYCRRSYVCTVPPYGAPATSAPMASFQERRTTSRLAVMISFWSLSDLKSHPQSTPSLPLWIPARRRPSSQAA